MACRCCRLLEYLGGCHRGIFHFLFLFCCLIDGDLVLEAKSLQNVINEMWLGELNRPIIEAFNVDFKKVLDVTFNLYIELCCLDILGILVNIVLMWTNEDGIIGI